MRAFLLATSAGHRARLLSRPRAPPRESLPPTALSGKEQRLVATLDETPDQAQNLPLAAAHGAPGIEVEGFQMGLRALAYFRNV